MEGQEKEGIVEEGIVVVETGLLEEGSVETGLLEKRKVQLSRSRKLIVQELKNSNRKLSAK